MKLYASTLRFNTSDSSSVLRLLPLHLRKKRGFSFLFFSLTKLCQVLIIEITKSMVDSSDSNSDSFVTRRSTKSMKRKHDDDDDGEDISGTEAVLRRRNQLMKTMNMLPYHPTPKITWTKSHELVILRVCDFFLSACLFKKKKKSLLFFCCCL